MNHLVKVIGCLFALVWPSVCQSVCSDFLAERWVRQRQFIALASSFYQDSGTSFRPYIVRAPLRRTINHALFKLIQKMDFMKTKYVLIGPEPQTNLKGLVLSDLSPWKGLDSVHEQLARLAFLERGPYTIIIDPSENTADMLDVTPENSRFWRRIQRITDRRSIIHASFLIIMVTHDQIEKGNRDRAFDEILGRPLRFVFSEL